LIENFENVKLTTFMLFLCLRNLFTFNMLFCLKVLMN